MRLPRSVAAAGAALSLLLAFTAFRPPSTPGPLERDFEAYYAAGATNNAGGDPYSRAIWTAERRIPGVNPSRDELLPFVGPAAALPLWSLLARLPYRGAVAVWTAILLGALATVLTTAFVIARAARPDSLRAAIAIALAFASAPVIGALALGQAALVSAAGVAFAMVAYRARWAAGALGATLLAALQPNLTCVLAARLRSRWDVAVAASAAATFAVLTLVTGGGAGFVAYLERLSEHARAERFIAIQHTLAAIGYALGLPAAAATTLGVVIALAAVVATIGIIIRERLDATTATLFAGALLPLATPFFHEPDFVIELLAILVLALRARGRARGLASVAAVLILVDWLGLAQRHGAAGQIVCLGFAVAFSFMGLFGEGPRTWRPGLAGITALTILAAVAAPLALGHPAPTWPDMLPHHFRAAAALDVSGVWGAEQRAAGLGHREPVWGLLRTIPLAGCIALAAALIADSRQRRKASQPNVGVPLAKQRSDLTATPAVSYSDVAYRASLDAVWDRFDREERRMSHFKRP